jgi:predicted dehydrogenase
VSGSPIGVGIVGASPLSPGWATRAHLPALRALPEFRLKAVSTSRPQSAAAARDAFGVDAFDNATDLIAHPGVDLIVVSVRVPEHHQLVSAAIEAGKMVFCEWPLGRTSAEAQDLARRARLAGVRNVVGLQASFAPAIRYLADLIADGYIGDVLSTSLVGSGMAWGATTDSRSAYLFEKGNGATMVTVAVAHAIDAVAAVLGEFAELSATTAVRQRQVRVDDGSVLTATSPDQAAIQGTLQSGAVASIVYRGGESRATNLRWDITGSHGDLLVTSSFGNIQVADLAVEGGRGAERLVHPLVIPGSYSKQAPSAPAGLAANVTYLYSQFASDLRNGTHGAPGFERAVRLHGLLDAIHISAASGRAQQTPAGAGTSLTQMGECRAQPHIDGPLADPKTR